MDDDRDHFWPAALGAGIVVILIVITVLAAVGGLAGVGDFLRGPAAGWVQAVGSVIAIVAATRISAAELSANRRMERLRMEQEDLRRLTAIGAVVDHLDFLIQALRQDLRSVDPPSSQRWYMPYLHEASTGIKAIDLLSCPAVELISHLSNIRCTCDNLLIAIERHHASIDEPDEEVYARGLKISAALASSNLRSFRELCARAIAKRAHEPAELGD